jgi:hypothetical protein
LGAAAIPDPDPTPPTFDISAAFQPSPAKTVYVEPQANAPTGIWASADGLQVFIAQSSIQTVFQYTMTTAWDLSTASYSGNSFRSFPTMASIRSIYFTDDGLKTYMTDGIRVYQFTLGTAWDITTAVYDSKNYDLTSDVAAGTSAIGNGVNLSSDGTKLFALWLNTDAVHEWSLSIPYDVSTATYAGNIDFHTGQTLTGNSGFFDLNGWFYFVDGFAENTIY